jgi:FkbM family methyltransferase
VEPLPDLFRRLKATYSGQRGLQFANVAISSRAGRRNLYRISPKAVARRVVPAWAEGIGTFHRSRNAIGRRNGPRLAFPGLKPHVVKVSVKCKRLDALLREHRIETIDLLQIDAEGHDYLVLKQVDLGRYRPHLIRMEWGNLPASERRAALSRLRRGGYQTVELGFDLVAWRKRAPAR